MRQQRRGISYPIGLAFTSIAIILMLACGCDAANTPAAAAKPPVKMFRIGFTDIKGNVLFLHDFKGKPVIINLWASWCAPCVEEMPSLAKVQSDYKAKGLVVLALSEDDTIAQAAAFYKAKSIALAPLYDKNHMAWLAMTQNLPDQDHGIPITVLINRKGVAVRTFAGPVKWQSAKMQKELQAILQ